MVRLFAGLRTHRADILLSVVFFALGAFFARNVLVVQPRPVFFYQSFLGAAALQACGLGFHQFAPGTTPKVFSEFLEGKTRTLSCDELPREATLHPPNWFESMHRYLAASLTIVWKIRGVSWNVLAPLFEIAGGLVGALSFAIGRMALNRFWAGFVAMGVVASGLNLGYLSWFRDYSKAPFLLASLWICALLVTRGTSWRRIVALSFAQGLVVGIGLGFRTDVIIVVPLFLLVGGLLLPRVRPVIPIRAAAIGAFCLAFVVSGWPVLRAYGQGGNSPHVMLLGFAESFDNALGLAPADYVVTPTYWDLQTEMQVRAYSVATGGSDWAAVSTVAYDERATRYLREVIGTLPADVAVRGYAAILKVFRLPTSEANVRECASLGQSLSGRACRIRAKILGRVGWLFLPSAILVVVIGSAMSLRLGLFLCAAIAVFAGSTMLQYDPRHVFYLEILPLWSVAFLLQHFWKAPGFVLKHAWSPAGWGDPVFRRRILGGTAAAGAVIVIPLGTLAVARMWQQRHLEPIFARYLSAEVDPLVMEWVTEPGIARVSIESFMPPLEPAAWQSQSLRAEVIRAEWGGPACRAPEIAITLRYQTTFGDKVLKIPAIFRWPAPAAGGTTQVFFPLYRSLIGEPDSDAPSGEFRALGIDVQPGDVSCLVSLSRVRDPRAFPIQLALALGPDWREGRRYHVMTIQSRR